MKRQRTDLQAWLWGEVLLAGLLAASLALLLTHPTLRAQYDRPELLLVLETAMALAGILVALLAGARFLVSAALVPEMIEAARARDAMSMPGTMTPSEMVKAAELGADFIKVFPVSALGGPDFIQNVRRALIHLPLVATGNIELDEIPDYFNAGVVGFGIGAPLIRTDLLERGDEASVIANAQRYLAATRRPATN